MNWKFWKREKEPEPDSWQTTITRDGCVVEIISDLRDGLGREMAHIVVSPLEGWRVRKIRGMNAIKVYKLKHPEKVNKEGDNDHDSK